MTPYIVVAFSLIILAIVETLSPTTRVWPSISFALVLTFGAFRYQTGYDWLAYEEFFETSVDIRTAWSEGIPPQDPPMEPLYLTLNMLIQSIGGSLTLLFFLIAAFNISVIHAIMGRISQSQCVVWAVYFGVAFPIAQMSALRYAVAASFVLVSLFYSAKQRSFLGCLYLTVAMGFHFSAIVFAPLLLLRNYRPSVFFVTIFVGLGLIATILNLHPIDSVIEILNPWLPDWLSEKLLVYSGAQPAGLSVATGLLILGYIGLLCFFFAGTGEADCQDPFIILAIWLTLTVLGAHLFFSGFPGIWNRVMCVSLPWQIAALCRTERFAALRTATRVVTVSSLGIVGLVSLTYLLIKPESKPLVPYHSLFQVWLSNDEGDGRIRSEEWMAEFATANRR